MEDVSWGRVCNELEEAAGYVRRFWPCFMCKYEIFVHLGSTEFESDVEKPI